MTQPNTEIVLPEGVSTVQKYTQEDMMAVAKTGDYLPRLQVNTFNTTLVTDGKSKVGIFTLVYDTTRFEELKSEIDIIAYMWRPFALDLRSGTPLAYYDRHDAAFKAVQALSGERDSGCLAGPQFLIWIPTAGDEGKIASLFCGGKSAKKQGPVMLSLMKKGEEPDGTAIYGPSAMTLKTKLIPKSATNKYTWWTFDTLACNSPIAVQPDQEDLAKEFERFQNPPKQAVVRDPDAGNEKRER